MKILAITPYPVEGASSRYRVHQFKEPLASQCIELQISSFMSSELYDMWQKNKILSPKIISGLLGGSFRRIFEALYSSHYDLIWIHKQIAPAFHRVFDTLFASLKLPIVFDMDDAVFMEYPIEKILNSSAGAIVGNQYLAKYVELTAPQAKILISPTVVDTQYYLPLSKERDKNPTVGWIGTSATFKRYLLPVLNKVTEVCRANGANLEVIASQDARESVEAAGGTFIPWSLHGELAALQNFDIGLMPLADDQYSRGKCAFKLIEYGAVGIPGIGTRIGANEEVLSNGITGYLTDSVEEMCDRLEELIQDFDQRTQMGKAARQKIAKFYSLESQSSVLATFFHQIIDANKQSKLRTK